MCAAGFVALGVEKRREGKGIEEESGDAGPGEAGSIFQDGADESQEMGAEDIGKLCRGTCGTFGLGLLFWSLDESIVKCPKRESEHQKERGEAINLSINETSEVACLMLVKKGKRKEVRAREKSTAGAEWIGFHYVVEVGRHQAFDHKPFG